ncbi:MAG TPA: hypothetical protein DDY70_06900, partial [Clostridiales bacterium]|nr:hypothetical protein [Clostridiales bacterium]
GISLVVAASNDYSSGFGGGHGTNLASNPDSGTVGSPSTYDSALSVASINGQKASYIFANDDEDQVAFITEASDENGNSYDFVDLLYKKAGKEKTERLKYKYVLVGGVGRPTNYTAQIKRELQNKDGYDGTIALVRRGDITFAEKVQNAMDNGADACIIYNNLSGTIRMSLGEVDDPIPTCSITMDAGKVFAENVTRNVGTVTIGADLKAGPFMSDFSSWGPTPDLRLRPEITAHGGEITSAVAGGYDIYSGTSMAAPNMAGAIALLRQHLKETTGLTGPALAARVNQVLMSTATIALNEEGNPYSPRKQGAGLAGIRDAIESESYITVPDGKGGSLDKTKIELFDDKDKVGEYEFTFVVNNITDKAATYTPKTYVMTETLATDGKTVAEKAHLLTDSTVSYTVGGEALTGTLTVPANGSVAVTVKITLGAEGRKYLDESFENGMYVEGFVSLGATGDTKITVGLPYLAFYGDWNAAPLFDYSEYELAESQKDTGVPAEDKLVASASATRIIGRYYNDKYIIPMGTYIYTLDDTDVQIYPDPDKIAMSIFDTENNHTIYELYMVYAGLLRGAAYMDIEIKDAATGDVIYFEQKENVSKSYAAGGSNRGSPVMLEIRPDDWGMVNNGTYLVSLKGQLDYPGGENPDRNTFDFKFTVDYEAPRVTDYRIRYEAYTENKQTKYRIYMDVDVFDNQYVQDVMPCYVREDKNSRVLTLATEKPIPVYGEKGKSSTVSFEITDIYDEYVKTGKLYLAVEDYAMNQSTYVVDALTGLGDAGTISLAEDGVLYRTETVKKNSDKNETPYYVYEMSLAPNQVYKPTIIAPADSSVWHSLTWTAKRGGAYVLTKNEEIFAAADGAGEKVILELSYGSDDDRIICAELELTIEGDAGSPPIPEKITIAPTTNGSYYVVNPETASEIALHPNMELSLGVNVTPWYAGELDLTWSSSNSEVVSVDAVGTIKTHKKGTAYITVTAEGYDRLKKTVRVTVDGDYRVLNYTLYDYYGGENCEIPKDLTIMYIDEECFWYNETLKRVVLPATLTELPKNAFKGCVNLEEIVIPSQCIVIGESAFSGCGKLKKVTFGMFADRDGNISDTFNGTITIGKEAFKDCVSLETIENQKRMTSLGKEAFAGCTSLTSLDLTELRVAGTGVFRGCTSLTSLTLGKNTAIGEEMFAGCNGLTSVTFPGAYLGAGAFLGCKNLSSILFTSDDFTGIGESALASTALTEVTLPNGTYSLGESAFGDCKALMKVTLSDGTHLLPGTASPFTGCSLFGKISGYVVTEENPFHSVENGLLYNKEKTELISVPVSKRTLPAFPASLQRIAAGAFAGVGEALTAAGTLDLSALDSIGAYAFTGSSLKKIILPATMTELAPGVFANCSELTSVDGAERLLAIGEKSFRNCGKLTSLDLTAALAVGDEAFYGAKLTDLTAPVLREVGTRAFCSVPLTALNLPALTTIGSYAFAQMSSLTTATLGPVTSMGSAVFNGSARLASVSFADGTTLVGDFAFYSLSNLATVTLPDSVKVIGDAAFAGTAITTVNLSGVTTVGQLAFYRATVLRTADLSSAVTVGDGAFGGTALTTANLVSAKSIGNSAFADTPLTSVTFGALESVGAYAFTRTRLTSVTLPATFKKHKADYTWDILDEKGRVKETKTRKVDTYGIGAFSAIPTLTEILVAPSSDDFVSLDGVLYAKGADGLILCQYPAGRTATAYTLAAGTVSVEGHAFEDTRNLVSVEFPYTVKRIGAYAFYLASVTHYTFNSVEAPALLASYVDPASVRSDTLLYTIFGESTDGSTLESTIYYANFYDFVAKRVYKDIFNPEF